MLKRPPSIQWTLQLWHAGLMALVLVGFGTFTYVAYRQIRLSQVEAELDRTAQVVMSRFPGPGGPGGPGGRGGRNRGMEDRGGPDFRDSRIQDNTDGDRQFGGGGGGMGGGGGRGRGGGFGAFGQGPGRGFGFMPPDFERITLPMELFGEGAGGRYCIVWRPDGSVLANTKPVEGVPDPGVGMGNAGGLPEGPPPGFMRTRGDYLEAVRFGPFMTRFVVGQSLAPVYAEIDRAGWLLAAAGAGVLVIGLAGGWMLSKRAVRPIGKITRVAEEVSASSLSQRIELNDIPSEFVSLAAVLNETFARLEAAFSQQVRFTADASHELRTPLSVIHTHAQLALSRERSAEEYKKTIATCLRASNRMKGLVDSLLLLASADAGRLTLDPQVFDLRDVVEECAALVEPLGEEKRVTVTVEPGEAAEVEADAIRISQVVINLLSNAIRYNREAGQVTATIFLQGEYVMLKVADTGVGIPPEHQQHMFERFYRVDKARSREVGGSGLGLAICRNIIDAHGGEIGFASKGEGMGTVFTVKLPRKHRIDAGHLAPAKEAAGGAASGK
jgi:signal transduction histidine kinase